MADSVVKAVLLGFNCRHASKNVPYENFL
jgi:hypothetical protein